MDIQIEIAAYENRQIDTFSRLILDEDYEALNSSISVEYSITLKSGYKLIGFEGVFLILSSLLFCHYRVLELRKCALYLSDSPPNVIFIPVSKDFTDIEIDSYGSCVEDERIVTYALSNLLHKSIDKIYLALEKQNISDRASTSNIIRIMNHNIPEISEKI